jgi:hypothetical protein
VLVLCQQRLGHGTAGELLGLAQTRVESGRREAGGRGTNRERKSAHSGRACSRLFGIRGPTSAPRPRPFAAASARFQAGPCPPHPPPHLGLGEDGAIGAAPYRGCGLRWCRCSGHCVLGGGGRGGLV